MRRWLAAVGLGLAACRSDPTVFDGEYGRAIPLTSGDASPLPRFAFIDEGCPGSSARNGCDASGSRACQPVLVDSLAPLTFFKGDDGLRDLSFGRECIEMREAAGLGEDPPPADALAAAVARFRFRDLPVVRAPAGGSTRWEWAAGDQSLRIEPAGVLGGNLLRKFAVELRTPLGRPARLALYGEFPGTERDLADGGLAFIPLQFPGRLLGRDLADRCDIGGDDCELGGSDIQGNPDLALEASRMVVDACVAAPPCGVSYELDAVNLFDAGTCAASVSPDPDFVDGACVAVDDPEAGGLQASLVVATGVPSLVLFDDSARRMFGTLQFLESCDEVTAESRACLLGTDGALSISGWPAAPAEGEEPLFRLAVRSVALLPGLTRTRGEGPCVRAQQRVAAITDQCNAFVDDFERQGTIDDTSPPYAAGDSDSALAIMGETQFASGQTEPDPERWIETLVLPETHPLALSLRRDVAPEAIQPDGLIGAGVFEDTVTILDYTDPNPGVRVQCLDPRSGDCLVAPSCSQNTQPACCFGLPLNLLVEFIVLGDDDTCCGALSTEELLEIQEDGFCLGVSPP